MCLNETTILHEEMKPQVNNSVVTTEDRVVLLRGTSAGCILILQLHNRHFATLLPPNASAVLYHVMHSAATY